ncbi:hypothetical protein K503DRAFT_776263 [Rhizopogon vinicolor AM-OR11-026]|uniref:Uncharacterized protein n=1 Tax=Rhizopogon vinicolor AM-OR11-026 TaxID=1314800 RepID=A0A1B7MJR7_9AGAM|nr:hypothetical protein K503DRAFT_776263 [Rhizopogon vinicolor AM-OR11-026]
MASSFEASLFSCCTLFIVIFIVWFFLPSTIFLQQNSMEFVRCRVWDFLVQAGFLKIHARSTAHCSSESGYLT